MSFQARFRCKSPLGHLTEPSGRHNTQTTRSRQRISKFTLLIVDFSEVFRRMPLYSARMSNPGTPGLKAESAFPRQQMFGILVI
jgi:hypothetical protein